MPDSQERARLLALELNSLLLRMRHAEDPFAAVLEAIVGRFMADESEDRPDEAERIVGPVLKTLEVQPE